MIENIIQEYVKNCCKIKNNRFTESFYQEHLIVVSEYACKLSDLLNGDKEIVRLSAFLHDISAVLDFSTVSTHNIKSSEIAENILSGYNYPPEKIEMVKQCIINHTSPLNFDQGTTEEICLSNADAVSQIARPAYWLFFAYHIRKLNYVKGKEWYLNRINSNWNMLIEPARIMIEDKYLMVKKLF